MAASRCAHLPLARCSWLVVFTSSAFPPVFIQVLAHDVFRDAEFLFHSWSPPFPGDRRCADPGRPHSSQRRSWLPVLADYGWKVLMLLYIHKKKVCANSLQRSTSCCRRRQEHSKPITMFFQSTHQPPAIYRSELPEPKLGSLYLIGQHEFYIQKFIELLYKPYIYFFQISIILCQ